MLKRYTDSNMLGQQKGRFFIDVKERDLKEEKKE